MTMAEPFLDGDPGAWVSGLTDTRKRTAGVGEGDKRDRSPTPITTTPTKR